MITIVDYGLGNLRSVENALEFLGCPHHTTAKPAEIADAKKLILPGVGSFRAAMDCIESRDLRSPILEAVERGAFMLGICLGMQLLAQSGDEDGRTDGLALIPGRVTRLTPTSGEKIPHIGFNAVEFAHDDSLFSGLGVSAEFYFVHSFRFDCSEPSDVIGWCNYAGRFAAVVRRQRVYGMQFHPEKSQTNGLRLLLNFIALEGG